MEKWKKQLFKLNREIRRKEQEGLLQKLNPLQHLNDLIQEDEREALKNAKSATSSEIASPISMDNTPHGSKFALTKVPVDQATDNRSTQLATTVY